MFVFLFLLLSCFVQAELDAVARIRLEELALNLDSEEAAVRAEAQNALEAYLDGEAKARWVREKIDSVGGERKARLRRALDAYEFRIGEHVAFVKNSNIWIMSAGGKALRPLTSVGDNRAPSFSPDGKKIAYASNRTGAHEIYVMDADGRNEVQITRSRIGAFDPVFSPDGKRIAFSHDGAGKGIRSVDLKGNDEKVVHSWGEWPSYSADGRQILFTGRERTGQGNVFLVDKEVPGERAITALLKPKALNFHARFSSDGRKVVLAGWNPGGAGGLFLMNPDGKELTPIAVAGRFQAWPSFSPDGRQILYCRSAENLQGMEDRHFVIIRPEIVVCDLEGKSETILAEGTFPAWGVRIKP